MSTVFASSPFVSESVPGPAPIPRPPRCVETSHHGLQPYDPAVKVMVSTIGTCLGSCSLMSPPQERKFKQFTYLGQDFLDTLSNEVISAASIGRSLVRAYAPQDYIDYGVGNDIVVLDMQGIKTKNLVIYLDWFHGNPTVDDFLAAAREKTAEQRDSFHLWLHSSSNLDNFKAFSFFMDKYHLLCQCLDLYLVQALCTWTIEEDLLLFESRDEVFLSYLSEWLIGTMELVETWNVLITKMQARFGKAAAKEHLLTIMSSGPYGSSGVNIDFERKYVSFFA